MLYTGIYKSSFKLILDLFENSPKTQIKSAKPVSIFAACSIFYLFNNCPALSIVDAL
jgi:hypothetical protein